MNITQEELKYRLSYDPETGIFTWKNPVSKKLKAGDVAGWITVWGYRAISINSQVNMSHRLAWLYMTGEWPDIIDHENHNRTDNRFENLKSVTKMGNCLNNGMRSDNSSGVVGVNWCKQRGKWNAYINADHKRIPLGRFDDFETAVSVRKKAERSFGYHPNHGMVANG